MREIIIILCCIYDIVCLMMMSILSKTFSAKSVALLHLINKYALISESSSSSYNWNRHTCYNEKGLKKMAMWSGHWCCHKSNKNRLLKKGSFNLYVAKEWSLEHWARHVHRSTMTKQPKLQNRTGLKLFHAVQLPRKESRAMLSREGVICHVYSYTESWLFDK